MRLYFIKGLIADLISCQHLFLPSFAKYNVCQIFRLYGICVCIVVYTMHMISLNIDGGP